MRTTGGPPVPTGPGGLPEDVRAGVTSALDRYLNEAVLAPLRSGGPAPDLTPVFTGSAAQRLGGPDRATVVDEGLPPATGGVSVDLASAALTALLDVDGAVPLVSARIDLRLRAAGRGGLVGLAREGEMVLVPDAGGWKIDGYELRVTRNSMEPVPTTVPA